MLDNGNAKLADTQLDVTELKRVGGTSLSSLDIHFAPRIDSTMNLIPWCADNNISPNPGFCLIAGNQTHGVGQHGKWESTDRDVKLSVVLSEVNSPLEHALVNCAGRAEDPY